MEPCTLVRTGPLVGLESGQSWLFYQHCLLWSCPFPGSRKGQLQSRQCLEHTAENLLHLTIRAALRVVRSLFTDCFDIKTSSGYPYHTAFKNIISPNNIPYYTQGAKGYHPFNNDYHWRRFNSPFTPVCQSMIPYNSIQCWSAYIEMFGNISLWGSCFYEID